MRLSKMAGAVIKYNTGHTPTAMELRMGRVSWPVCPVELHSSRDTLYTYEEVIMYDDDGDYHVGIMQHLIECSECSDNVYSHNEYPNGKQWKRVVTVRDFVHLGVALQRLKADWEAV